MEEIIVTAEKRDSTVSDTSVVITAFDNALIDELGIQVADRPTHQQRQPETRWRPNPFRFR
jgi:hypothetical protein